MSDGSSARFSILFVEDDRMQAELIEIACSKVCRSIECNISYDVQEAKAYLQTNVPHVILADMNLGGETGLDLLKWVKNSASNKDIPFYLWTYRPPTALQQSVKTLGGEGVLERFSNFQDLCQTIIDLKTKHS